MRPVPPRSRLRGVGGNAHNEYGEFIVLNATLSTIASSAGSLLTAIGSFASSVLAALGSAL